MKIDITELLKKQRGTYEVHNIIEDYNGTYIGKDIKFLSPLELKGTFTKVGDSINFKGNVKADLLLNCSRCLEEFTYNLDLELEEDFCKKQQEQEEAMILEGNTVDFEEIVLNAIDFALPIKKLCKEDCKGICFSCGTNLNTKTCLCNNDDDDSQDEFIDPRFAKLKNLFKDK